MSGNPISQSFTCTLTTSLPASILSTDDVISLLNFPGSGFWNDTLGGAITLDVLSGVTSSSITSSLWSDVGGNAILTFTLNTVSDPVTASSIQGDIVAIGGVLAIAIGAAIALIGPPGWAVDLFGLVLVLIGALTILSVGVALIVNSPTGQLLIYAVVGIAVIGAGVFLYSFATSAKTRKSVRSGVEHISAQTTKYVKKHVR